MKKNIFTVKDLLFYFPIRYEDRSSILSIYDSAQKCKEDEDFVATIICVCIKKSEFRFKNRKIKKFVFTDNKEKLAFTAFNPFFRYFKENEHYILSGKVKWKNHQYELTLLDYEIFDEEGFNSIHLGRIVPIYSSTQGLSQKNIRSLIKNVFDDFSRACFHYQLPKEIIKQYRYFDSKKEDLKTIHFPSSHQVLKESRNRLVYEEFFGFQYQLYKKKLNREKGKEKNRYLQHSHLILTFQKKLPFDLTLDQKKVIFEITEHMKTEKVMNRLLQGDVGSGKTLVALISMLLCYESEHQCVLMVPTDMLARQHYETFKKYLTSMEIDFCLLTNSISEEKKKEVLHQIKNKKSLMVIGTHSLIQDSIFFLDLKYIVIDEQHKFGVEQREKLKKKGTFVDTLTMSATPIPRSLCMTFFGDLDLSTIKELPLDYKKKQTKLLMEKDRMHAYRFLMDRIKKGEQGYVVFPTIEEGVGKINKSLVKEFDFLKKNIFKSIPIRMIHGKSDLEDRKRSLKEFEKGIVKVLFTTTIIEVGIHYPNATVLIVESSQRFGLSQLHQLRGRIGRNSNDNFCYLIHQDDVLEKAYFRLGAFCNIQDGFKLAEIDLQTRGPGEFLGQKQSGIPLFKIGVLARDFELLKKSRKDVQKYLIDKIN